MSDLVDEILGDLGKPVLAGLVFGHTKEKVTLPMGVECELDAGEKKVTIDEAATVRPRRARRKGRGFSPPLMDLRSGVSL